MTTNNQGIEPSTKDQDLINVFISHLTGMGFNSSIEGLKEDNGVRRGYGVTVWIESIDKSIRLLLSHGRSESISLSDKFKMDEGDICLVISPSDKNNLGYISSGICKEGFENIIDKSGGKGWTRRLPVTELGFVNLKKWLVHDDSPVPMV